MSKLIKGVIYHKGYNEVRGTKLWYVKLDNEKYYGFGEDEPKYDKGDKVKFYYSSYKDNGGTLRYKFEKLLKKIGTGDVPEYKSANKSGGGKSSWKGKSGGGGGGNWTPGSTVSAARGRSFEIAASVAAAAFAAGVLPVPKATATTKKDGSALDLFLDVVQRLADDYLAQIIESSIAGEAGLEAYLKTFSAEDAEDEEEDDEESYDDEGDEDEEDEDEEDEDEDDEEDEEDDEEDYEDD